MKRVNNFHIAKVQPQGVAQHLLDFPGNFSLKLFIKSVAYEKSVRVDAEASLLQ